MTPENYETWRDIMISYGETVIKNSQRFMKVWQVWCLKPIWATHEIKKPIRIFSGLYASYVITFRNFVKFLPQPLHIISWHHDKFHDFLTMFAFYKIQKQNNHKFVVKFRVHDVWNFWSFFWIRCQCMLKNMNNNFPFIFHHYLNDL